MCQAWNAEKVCMETSKQVASMILETIKSNPLVCGIGFFLLALLPGIVKLANMLPGAN
jgi:hypothetical protein